MAKMKTLFTKVQRSRGLSLIGGTLLMGCLALAVGCDELNKPSAKTANDTKGQTEALETEESANKIQEAVVAMRAKDFNKAKQLLAEAHAISPKSPRIPYYTGMMEQTQNNKPAAIKAYEEAIALDAKLVEARINATALLIEDDTPENLGKAAKILDEGLKITPDNVDLMTNRAFVALAGEDYASAATYYGKFVPKSPDLRLHFQYARALSGSGKQDLAAKELEPVYGSDDVKLVAAAGALHAQIGDFKGCVAALDKVIQKKPTADLLLRRGECKRGLQQFPAELDDYKEAVKLEPTSAGAQLALGRHLHFVETDDKQAAPILEEAKKLGQGTRVAAEAERVLGLIAADAAKKGPTPAQKGKPKKK